MASSKSQIQLVPWDFDSPDHLNRLVEQRIQCGWHHDKVKTLWRDEQRAGTKCIYWIVISPEDPEEKEKLELHFSQYPSDKKPLQDTSTSLRGVPRTPTEDQFYPIGHISLDSSNPGAKALDLDLPTDGVYWIKTFYISTALRSKRIGATAMAMAESMAINEPLCAKTLALDTVCKEDQLREDFAIAYFGEVPKFSNQGWYEKMGYQVIKIVNAYDTTPDRTGKVWDFRGVFLKKNIV